MSDCEPFSQCWCEKHPKGYDHPNCKPELEIGGFVFNSIFFICFLVFLILTTTLNRVITKKPCYMPYYSKKKCLELKKRK